MHFAKAVFAVGICLVVAQVEGQPTSNQREEAVCHPTPQNPDEVYIVGYGSLLSTVSKNKTYANTGDNIPVNVKGYSRKWNCKGAPIGLSTTFLGVEKNSSAFFNGVVFKLPNLEGLGQFDKREIYYCREEVKFQDIEWLIKNGDSNITLPSENAQFWIYVVKPEAVQWPSERYPIVQSYVDVFLTGCLEMEKTYGLTNYSDNCLNTTDGWAYPWVNDRVLPRRPFVHQPNAWSIDNLIDKHLPKHFEDVQVGMEIKHNFGRSGEGNNGAGRLSVPWVWAGMVCAYFGGKFVNV